MRLKAVIDRFEGAKAVILVGDEEEQLVVPRAKLPPGAQAGSWLSVEVRDDVLIEAEIDEQSTAAARARIKDKLARLRKGDHLK